MYRIGVPDGGIWRVKITTPVATGDHRVSAETRGSRTLDASVDPTQRNLLAKKAEVFMLGEGCGRRAGEASSEPMEGGEWATRAKVDKRVARLTRSMSWLECGPSCVCKQSGAGPMGGRGICGIR